LDDFLAGRLPDFERALFQEHLQRCRACDEEIRDYERIRSLLGSADVELGSVPAGLAARIEREVKAAELRRRAWWRVGAVASAAGVLLAVAVWSATSRRHTRIVGADASPTVQKSAPEPAPKSTDLRQQARSPVRLEFDRAADAIAVPIESADPHVSIFWVYPIFSADRSPSESDTDASQDFIRSKT
jgi:hypothetical protein